MSTRPYRQLVGALAWLALGTRPDIAFAVSSLARFGHNPRRVHWEAAKRVLRYLKGTRGWRLTLGGKVSQVAAFTDADWGSHRDDRHSVRAYIGVLYPLFGFQDACRGRTVALSVSLLGQKLAGGRWTGRKQMNCHWK
jgi:hypothetical protein